MESADNPGVGAETPHLILRQARGRAALLLDRLLAQEAEMTCALAAAVSGLARAGTPDAAELSAGREELRRAVAAARFALGRLDQALIRAEDEPSAAPGV